jgi:hypothetical protein
MGAFGWELSVNKEKESVFLRIKKGKHFLALTFYFLLTGIEFSLTDFPYACQIWESGENGFQENKFLETNKAWVSKTNCKNFHNS